MSFMLELMARLEADDPKFRDRLVLQLDNMGGHKTAASLRLIESMGVPTIFFGPAMYLAAGVESVFGAVKLQDLNWNDLPTSW